MDPNDHLRVRPRTANALCSAAASPRLLGHRAHHVELQNIVAGQRRDREETHAIADLLRRAPPHASNDTPPSDRLRRWAPLKTILRRRKHASRRRSRDSPSITLPDSAVAGTTIGGHRHIAISIPMEHSPLGPRARSQYPVFAGNTVEPRAARTRAASVDSGVVTVLRPFADDHELARPKPPRSALVGSPARSHLGIPPSRPPTGPLPLPPKTPPRPPAKATASASDNSVRCAAPGEPADMLPAIRESPPAPHRHPTQQRRGVSAPLQIPPFPGPPTSTARMAVPRRRANVGAATSPACPLHSIDSVIEHRPHQDTSNQFAVGAANGSPRSTEPQPTPPLSAPRSPAPPHVSPFTPQPSTHQPTSPRPAPQLPVQPPTPPSSTPQSPLLPHHAQSVPRTPARQEMPTRPAPRPPGQQFGQATVPRRDGTKSEASPTPQLALGERRTRRERVRERKQRDIQVARAKLDPRGTERDGGSGAEATLASNGPSRPPPEQAGSSLRNGHPPSAITPIRVIADVEPSTPPPEAATAPSRSAASPPPDAGSEAGGSSRFSHATPDGGGPLRVVNPVTMLRTPPPSPPALAAAGDDAARLPSPQPSPARVSSVQLARSVPLDRTSLARRREWNTNRARRPQSTYAGLQRRSSRSRVGPVDGGEGSGRAARQLTHRDLVSCYEQLEGRLCEIEKEGDVWLSIMVPLLMNLNRMLERIHEDRQVEAPPPRGHQVDERAEGGAQTTTERLPEVAGETAHVTAGGDEYNSDEVPLLARDSAYYARHPRQNAPPESEGVSCACAGRPPPPPEAPATPETEAQVQQEGDGGDMLAGIETLGPLMREIVMASGGANLGFEVQPTPTPPDEAAGRGWLSGDDVAVGRHRLGRANGVLS